MGEAARNPARFLQTDDGGIGGLLGGGVFAGGFSKLFACLGDVQDVVDDLEGQPHVVTEFGQGLELGAGAIGAHASQPG